ncbi:MAG: hypothetical protein HY720_04555 [Planctomycetes bacterium]|nr:hypothetical protein [Planctomycetota bacterium]
MEIQATPTRAVYEALCPVFKVVVPIVAEEPAGQTIEAECPACGRQHVFHGLLTIKPSGGLHLQSPAVEGTFEHTITHSAASEWSTIEPLDIPDLGKSTRDHREALERMRQAQAEPDKARDHLEEALRLLRGALRTEEKLNEIREIGLVSWDLADVLERLARISPADRDRYIEEARSRIGRAVEIGKRFLGPEKMGAIRAIEKRLRSP